MVYYDCSVYDDDIQVFTDTLPCSYDASWVHFRRQIYWSVLVYSLLWLFCKFFSSHWNRIKDKQAWAKQWIGTQDVAADNVKLDAALRVVQLVASTTIGGCWIWKSYEKRVAPAVYGIEIIACLMCMSHLVFSLFKNGFSTDYALGIEGFIDAFTITPLLLQGAPGGTWLTVAYLRTYRTKTAFYRLCATGILEPYMGELSQALVRHFVDFIVCLTWIACTMYIFEGLGDVKYFQDNFFSTEMGDTSFFQLCYMAMVTMTTVGYGDFSPSTVFNRLFFFVASAGGVTFFSVVVGEIADVMSQLSSGMGKFRPKHPFGSEKNPRGHILIMGGAVASPSKACVEDFLRSICRDNSTPEIVLLAPSCSEEVRSLLNEPWAKCRSIQYFKGDASNAADLARVRAEEASMTFILADFFTQLPYGEDHDNVLRAAALQAYYPSAQYRLMTIEVRHLDLCMNVGLNMFNCYAIDGLKAATLATALRCPGLPTLVINMGLPDIEGPGPYDPEISPWLSEYIDSAGLELYGFMPATKFRGKTFREAAIMIAEEADAAVVAIQIEGSLVINPKDAVVTDRSILFALAADQDKLHTVAFGNNAAVPQWLPQFSKNRKDGHAEERFAAQHAKLGLDQKYTASGSEGPRESVAEAPARKSVAEKRLIKPGMGIPKTKKQRQRLASITSVTSNSASSIATNYAELHVHPDEIAAGAPPASLLQNGGHVVLALISQASDPDAFQGLWQQVEVIVKNLRENADTPMVIISAHGINESSPVSAIAAQIRETYMEIGNDGKDQHTLFIVEGDPLKPYVLELAGVPTCGHFMTLSPSAPRGNGLMDRNNILAQMVLDRKLREWGREDLAAAFDWYSHDSFRLMPRAPKMGHPKDVELPNLIEGDKSFSKVEARCHYRYAAGRVLPKPLIAGLYSMAYYTPGVLELIEALIDPSKTQQPCSAFLMSVPPSFVGKVYADFAKVCMKKGAIPIGMLRSQKGPLPYVLSCTPTNKKVELQEGDGVYILADSDYVEENLPDLLSAPSQMTENPASRLSNPLTSKIFHKESDDSSYHAPPAETVLNADSNSPALSAQRNTTAKV